MKKIIRIQKFKKKKKLERYGDDVIRLNLINFSIQIFIRR